MANTHTDRKIDRAIDKQKEKQRDKKTNKKTKQLIKMQPLKVLQYHIIKKVKETLKNLWKKNSTDKIVDYNLSNEKFFC